MSGEAAAPPLPRPCGRSRLATLGPRASGEVEYDVLLTLEALLGPELALAAPTPRVLWVLCACVCAVVIFFVVCISVVVVFRKVTSRLVLSSGAYPTGGC